MKNKPKNIPSPYKFAGTKIFRDTTALPFADGGPLHDRDINGKLLNSTYASVLGNMFREGGPFGEDHGVADYATSIYASQPGNYYNNGGMIKRADGSYSQRGLWDNIRAAAGSNKKPTKEMLQAEKKIKAAEKNLGGYLYETGGQFPIPYSLPEDSYRQGGNNLHNSIYASSMAQYPATYKYGGSFQMPRQQMYMPLDNVERYGGNIYDNGGTINSSNIINLPEITVTGKKQQFKLKDPRPAYSKGYFDPWGIPDNTLENVVEIFDPTGISSWDDVIRAKNEHGTNSWQFGLELLGAIPLLGEAAKTIKSVQVPMTARQTRNYKTSINTLQNTSRLGRASDAYQAVDEVIKKNGGSILSMSNTPQLEGEGKDLTYPENAYIYTAGGDLQNNIFKQGGAMNFKSKGAYQNWLAYGHASGEFAKTPGNQPVSIQGKSHKVKHAMGGNLYAAGGSFNNPGFQALPPAVQAKIRANAQYGGYMYDNGGQMGQLTEFNEGGRHEENPLGGIPQGTAPDGRVNLVEQGETKLDAANYIFSDTLKVDKTAVEQFGLNKSDIGKTFAEVSKKLNRPNSRRENDTIEQVAIKRDLDSLMQAQEEFKQRDLEKDMAMMMQKHPQAMEALMQQQSVQPMGMPQGQPVDASQLPPEALAQMPEAQQGAPIMAYGGGMYKCGGKMYNLGGRMYENGDYLYLNNPYQQNNGLTGTANNGLNNSTLNGNMIMGAPQGAANDQGFRDLSGGTGGMIQGTAAGGAPTTSIEQAGGKDGNAGGGIGGNLGKAAVSSLAGMGTAYGASKMQEQAQSATANQNSGTAAGIKSGLTTAVSAVNPVVGGLIGLGQGIGNEQRMKYEAIDPQTGELQNQKKAEEGYVLGHFFDPIGSAIEDWSNPNLNFGQKLASTLGFSALVRKDYAKGLEKQAKENLGIRPEIEFKKRGAAAETSAMYSGYEDALEQQRQQNPYAQQAKYGGYQAQVPYHNYPAIYPKYPHNAGPMGMGLGTNLYPLGGPLDGDPVKTTTGTEVTVRPKPAIATYQFDPSQIDTGGLTYEQWYAKQLREYNNNPKDRRGIPSHGAGEGGWNPMPEEVRLQEIARLERLPKNQITPENVELYNNLLANKVYVGDMLSKDASLYNPETGLGAWIMPPSNLMKTNPLIQKTTPSVAPLPSKPTFENIGELATKPATQVDTRNISGERIPYKQGKQYNAETGKWETSFALNPSNPLAQQTQAAEDFRLKNLAYQNQQLAERGAAPMIDTSTHAPVGEQMNPLIEQYLVNKTKVNNLEPTNQGWEREGLGFAMGGHMYEDGGKKLNRNKILNTLSYLPQNSVNTDYTFPEEPMPFTFTTPTYTDVNVWGEQPSQVMFTDNLEKNINKTSNKKDGYINVETIYNPAATNSNQYVPLYAQNNLAPGEFMESLGYNIINAPTDEEADKAKKKYESEVARQKTTQTDKNIDLNVEQSTLSGLSQLGPVAYNIGMGLFGKPEYINAEDYMMKQSATPWEYNIQPQINAAKETYAQGQQALQNMSPGAGAYLSNLQSLANQRNKTFAELYGQKQNLDAAAYERAAAVNRQIAQQNIATKLQGLEYNQGLKGNKQKLLQEGIKQMAQLGASKDQVDLQLRYLGAVSPDYAGTASYTSFLDKMFNKVRKDKKEADKNEKSKKS